jgi:purine-nucleoside phosphorylase
MYEQIQETVAQIQQSLGGRAPRVGLVLGSGLGAYADRLGDAIKLDYASLPNFPVSTVEGHAGRLVIGRAGREPGIQCAAMQGRVHFYEGHALTTVTFPMRVLIALGCKTLVITNAAGGANPHYQPGELVALADHLNLFPDNPLRGVNDPRLGTRFPDMTRAYDPALRALAKKVAAAQGFALPEGVYAGSPGPTYETPAEVRMARAMGADLVGMSTVPEVIVARHGGARVLGISCVTNMAAGMTGQPLSHDEVTETATRVRERFIGLLDGVLTARGRGEA